MIQWERDFMCEDDSSVIVRCDRPDDFNKTISWNFRTLSLSSTIERNTHPGMKFGFRKSTNFKIFPDYEANNFVGPLSINNFSN